MTDRLRNFCFTCHDVAKFDELMKYEKAKYIVIGREICPTTGKPHLQGYCELADKVSFSVIAGKFGHIEKRRGTPQQAADYCKKEGSYQEAGTMSNPGKRTDLESVCTMVVEKKKIEENALEFPVTFVKYHKGITELMNLTRSNRTEKPTVIWLWGLAGVGKTRYASDRHSDRYIKDGTMWWNNYTQQEAIIIDDFDGKWPFRDLLRLLDRYEYQGQTKGGYVKINSPFIYITCEFPPTKYWRENELTQVTRRLDQILELKEFGGDQGCPGVVGNNMPPPEM